MSLKLAAIFKDFMVVERAAQLCWRRRKSGGRSAAPG